MLITAAKRGPQLKVDEFYNLISALFDPPTEQLAITMSDVLKLTKPRDWITKIRERSQEPNFDHCATESQHDMLLAMDVKKPERFD